MKKLLKIDEDAHQMLKTLSFRTGRDMGEIASDCIRKMYAEKIRQFQTRESDARKNLAD